MESTDTTPKPLRTRPAPPFVGSLLAGRTPSLSTPPASSSIPTEDDVNGGIKGQPDPFGARTPTRSPSKARSLSDSTPKLEPSPKFREPLRESKDDHAILSHPTTPRRPDFLVRGLSLQMPPRESAIQGSATFLNRAPLSPQLDVRNTYGSPTTLPRRSRGLEFSRACTNLHHSTLAEQSSPDSSPTITQKGIMIPRKRRSNSMALDSPSLNPSIWSSVGHSDKTAVSSSLGSINMLGSDSSSSSSEDDDPMDPDDNEDVMLMTPHATKMNSISAPTPFSSTAGTASWSTFFSPTGSSFLSIQRARLRKGRSRKSSSSASGHSSVASPGPASPPHGRSFEGSNGGYFAREAVMRNAGSRRQSLTMVTNELHISSGNDSGDDSGKPPSVVRRPVTRRGNLLPKTRAFNRLRAELLEEATPIDTEVRREAEIIRQVRESDDFDHPQSSTTHSSPTILPTVPGLNDQLEGIPEDVGMEINNGAGAAAKGLFGTFNLQPSAGLSGRGYWNTFEIQGQTPPPPILPRGASSVVSDDVNMDSPSISSSTSVVGVSQPQEGAWRSSDSRSSTPQPILPPTAAEGLKKANKRRRDDDFDVMSIKRRAVSPGMSVQNSPILSQSPAQRDSVWGQPKGERANSGGSMSSVTPSIGPKRVGLQGMTDTNDGLMKMTIE